MTVKSVNKTSARGLAALTGMPYQSCLTAVQVLRALPIGVTLADLESVIAGSGSAQAVLNLPGGSEVNYRGFLAFVGGGESEDTEVIIAAQQEAGLAVRLHGPQWGMPPSGASLWLEARLREDLLRPAGLWRTTAKRLLGAVESGAGDVAAVLADRAEDFEAMADVLDGAFPKIAYLSQELASVAATYTTAGPGFDWAHLTFADLDQAYGPDEQDHRLIECRDGNCGFLHDWPTADPTHTQITMPAPLLRAYQRVVALGGPNNDMFSNELGVWHGVTDDGSHWYGVEYYQSDSELLNDVSAIWMQVDPPAADSASFPPAVS